jgi:hypothetical protein
LDLTIRLNIEEESVIEKIVGSETQGFRKVHISIDLQHPIFEVTRVGLELVDTAWCRAGTRWRRGGGRVVAVRRESAGLTAIRRESAGLRVIARVTIAGAGIIVVAEARGTAGNDRVGFRDG